MLILEDLGFHQKCAVWFDLATQTWSA